MPKIGGFSLANVPRLAWLLTAWSDQFAPFSDLGWLAFEASN